MSEEMQKSILAIQAIFLLLGIGMFYLGINILYEYEDSINRGFILVEYDNTLVKYSFVLFELFSGLGCIVVTVLAQLRICPFDGKYKKGDKLEGAKQGFIFISIFIPAIVFTVIAFYYSKCEVSNPFPIVILCAAFVYGYFGSILKLTILRNKYKRHNPQL